MRGFYFRVTQRGLLPAPCSFLRPRVYAMSRTVAAPLGSRRMLKGSISVVVTCVRLQPHGLHNRSR